MASTYLTRAFSSGTITTKATWSFWVKFSKINQASGGASCMLFQARDANNSSNSRTYIRWGDGATLDFISYNSSGTIIAEYYTTRLLRDCNSWYHICYSVDTTLAAASDRVKLYINGVRETNFDTSNLTNPGVNQTIRTTSTVFTDISRNGGVNNNHLDGLLSYYIFTDGYTYQADTFGSTDSVTGQWKITTAPTVTYGTNGFFILENGNSVTDQSGNSNNFTVGGGTLTNALDNPSNVFCTMNAIATSSFGTLSNGNNTVTGNSAANNGNSFSTLCLPDARGKYYFEVKFTTIISGEYPVVAICLTSDTDYGVVLDGGAGDPRNRVIGMDPRGYIYNYASNAGIFPALSNGDIASFAFDMDNGAYYMSINGGAYLTSGSPTSGASRTGALATWTPNSSNDYGIWISPYNGSVCSTNFGNGYFGTSAVSSAGTSGSTPGTFEYDVPSGYEPLSTKGLNA